jgi:SAM-dependent methyltransferase
VTIPAEAHDHDCACDHDAPFASLPVEKMPAHWLMARLGKRVLRPGGMETTRWMLSRASVGKEDDALEFAPGLGVTAREILACAPRSYVGVERDPSAAQIASGVLWQHGHPAARVMVGDASRVSLPDGAASVVIGEAMLSMQPAARKRAIVAEAARLLRPGGRYAIHELAVATDDASSELLDAIEKELSRTIHVGVRIGTVAEWQRVLRKGGFELEAVTTALMRLLELDRLVQDEGLWGTTRFVVNALRTPRALERLRQVRASFRRYAPHLRAVAIVARRVLG